jgi:protein-disulfide isomerase
MLLRHRNLPITGLLLAALLALAACGGQPAPEAQQPPVTQAAQATLPPATALPPTAAPQPATAQATTAQAPTAPQPATAQATTAQAPIDAPTEAPTAAQAAPLTQTEKGLPVGQTSEGYWYIGSAEAPVTLSMYSDFL